MSRLLASWNDTPARQAIVEFVEHVTREDDAGYLPASERVAVFDNDGTLWCEKPMPIELAFILGRFAEMADADASLRERQPWKAACAASALRAIASPSSCGRSKSTACSALTWSVAKGHPDGHA
jgi:hypothetical protein